MWPWAKNWLIWSMLGIGFLFFGGLASHGYRRLLATSGSIEAATNSFSWGALLELSIGGGIVIGLIGLALTLASPRGVGWGLALATVGLLLFLIFIWPTPYKYYRDKGGGLIKVHRLTGNGDYVVPSSASASQR